VGARDDASRQRRLTVLQVTADLLDEIGFNALTLRQVAEQANVALGTLFLYAENKADLLMQVYGPRMTERWTTMLDDSAGRPALERMEQYYLDCIALYFTDKENIREFFRVSSQQPAARWEWLESLRARLRQILANGVRAGEIAPNVDLDILNSAYMAMFLVTINESYHGATQQQTERSLRVTFAILRNGVDERARLGVLTPPRS